MESPTLQATEDYSAAKATAPRVTLDEMKAKIVGEYYFTAGDALSAIGGIPFVPHGPLDLLTICLLVLDNGFVVLGKSAPASAENFDAEKGRRFAYENAIGKLWPLMGFALCERLSAER